MGATKPRYKKTVTVVQPPTHIVIGPGERLDITGLSADEQHDAISRRDAEVWDSDRFAAECARTTARFRKWVVNFYALTDAQLAEQEDAQDVTDAEDGEPLQDDRTLCAPDGYVGKSPWWYASRARRWAAQNGLQTRAGVAIPFKPSGRRAGGVENPYQRHAPTMRDKAPAILARYRELVDAGNTDVEARGLLAGELGMDRRAIARRLKAALDMEAKAAGAAVEVSNDRLLRAYRDMTGEAGSTDDEIRDALAAQFGISRRSLATRLKVAEAAEGGQLVAA